MLRSLETSVRELPDGFEFKFPSDHEDISVSWQNGAAGENGVWLPILRDRPAIRTPKAARCGCPIDGARRAYGRSFFHAEGVAWHQTLNRANYQAVLLNRNGIEI